MPYIHTNLSFSRTGSSPAHPDTADVEALVAILVLYNPLNGLPFIFIQRIPPPPPFTYADQPRVRTERGGGMSWREGRIKNGKGGGPQLPWCPNVEKLFST